jgi:hypothetical protein
MTGRRVSCSSAAPTRPRGRRPARGDPAGRRSGGRWGRVLAGAVCRTITGGAADPHQVTNILDPHALLLPAARTAQLSRRVPRSHGEEANAQLGRGPARGDVERMGGMVDVGL